jgi:hypothetical protein
MRTSTPSIILDLGHKKSQCALAFQNGYPFTTSSVDIAGP